MSVNITGIIRLLLIRRTTIAIVKPHTSACDAIHDRHLIAVGVRRLASGRLLAAEVAMHGPTFSRYCSAAVAMTAMASVSRDSSVIHYGGADVAAIDLYFARGLARIAACAHIGC